MYKKQIFLSKENSPSTSNVIAFDGIIKDNIVGDTYRRTFLEISDCNHKIKLHVAAYDTTKDFIEKLELLRDTISDFINHLKENKNETN